MVIYCAPPVGEGFYPPAYLTIVLRLKSWGFGRGEPLPYGWCDGNHGVCGTSWAPSPTEGAVGIHGTLADNIRPYEND